MSREKRVKSVLLAGAIVLVAGVAPAAARAAADENQDVIELEEVAVTDGGPVEDDDSLGTIDWDSYLEEVDGVELEVVEPSVDGDDDELDD